jgi:type IX secretion system PorP/SprF family membrane protein
LGNFSSLEYLWKILVVFYAIGTMAVPALAQDAGFSQFYSNPLYLNPAFTGTLGVPRVNLQYRDQWHALPNAYVTQSISFDIPSEKLKGAFGFNLVKDAQAANLLTSLQADLMYSSIFKLTEGVYFSGALAAGYHQNSMNWNELVFADNLDRYTGNHGVTAETPITDPRFQYADFSTGILVYGERFFTGLAAHHLAQPKVGWYDGSDSGSRLLRRFTLHFGTRIPIYFHGRWRKTFDLSPQVVLMQQGQYREFNYGMLANYRGFTAGTWLRQDLGFQYDAVVFLLGFMKKRWHITYSYDFTVSGLGAQSGGTSEISLSFLLKDLTQQTAFPFYQPYKDYIGEGY